MPRKNTKIIPIEFTKGLYTEVKSPLHIKDGGSYTTSNLMELNGALTKRYGITKIKVSADSDDTAVGTGLFVEYFNGAETLFRMDSTGIIKKCVSPAFAGADSWSTINVAYSPAPSSPTTIRWDAAKFTTFIDQVQLEKMVFTDNTIEPQVYSVVSGANDIHSLSSLGIEEGYVVPESPHIIFNTTEVHRVTVTSAAPSPSTETITMTNVGSTCDSWAIGGTTYSGGGTWVTPGASTGTFTTGSASCSFTLTSPSSTPGNYLADVTIVFYVGSTQVSSKHVKFYCHVCHSPEVSGDTYGSVNEIKYFITCEEGDNPSTSTYTFSMQGSGTTYWLYQTPSYGFGVTVFSSSPSGGVDWVTISDTVNNWATITSNPALNVTLGDVSNFKAGLYICSIPVWFEKGTETIVYTTLTIALQITSDTSVEGKNHYTPVKAKTVCSFAGRLLLGNVEEKKVRPLQTSTVFNNRVVWSDLVDLTNFGDDSYEDMPERGGSGAVGINAIRVFQGAAYVFADTSVHRINDSGNVDLPFTFDRDILDVGCKDPRTIRVTNRFILFKASDGTMRAFDGFRSYIISEPVLNRFKTDASNSACYDSFLDKYICNSTGTVTKLILFDFRPMPTNLGGAINDSVESLSTIEIYEESYPHTISFLANSATNCYALFTNSTTIYVAKLFNSSATTDPGTTAISFSRTTKTYTLGPNMIGNLDYITVRGVNSTGTVKITVYTQPGSESVATDVTLSATGVRIPIGKPVQEFYIKIENSASVVTQADFYTIEACFHNIRRI